MTMSFRHVLALVLAVSWLSVGCSSSSKKIQAGEGCTLNSDCHSPLSCSYGKCHDTCKETRDCPTGQSCVSTPQGSVCLLPIESDCQSTNGLCNTGLVCASDQRCRVACVGAADCLAGQLCAQGVCADSSDVAGNGALKPGSGVGTACTASTECNTPLSCVMGTCHYTCTGSSVCPMTQTCVKASGVSVCQLPAESGCNNAAGSACPAGLVCAGDNRCHTACRSASECTIGQVCTSGVCADPSDLTNGQLTPKDPPKLDAGAPAPDAAKDRFVGNSDTGITISIGGFGGTASTGGTGGAADAGAGATQMDAPVTGGTLPPDAGAGGTAGRDAAVADLKNVIPDVGRSPDTLTPDAPIKVTDDGGGSSTVLSGCGKVTTKRYFCDDFEGGLDNWRHATEGWGLTDKTYQSPGYSVTDSPNGNYPAGSQTEIIMVSSVDLVDAVSPILTFWHRLDIGTSSNAVYVDVSQDGGTTWSVLTTFSGANNTSVWSFQQVSLATAIGRKLKLRFRQTNSHSSWLGDGWYLDDIEIKEADVAPAVTTDGRSKLAAGAEATGCNSTAVGTRYYCEDFEAGLSNWLVATEGWNTVDSTSQSPNHSVTDSPNGNYPAGAQSDITMGISVDLTSAVSPILTFWHRLGIGTSSNAVYVDVSQDGGTTWSVLTAFWAGSNTTVWSFQQLSMATVAGKKIRLRFRLVNSHANWLGDGWYIDDIKIRENEFVPTPGDLVLCTSQKAGAACNAADMCRLTCGGDAGNGNKSLTCVAGKFVEGPCTFPTTN